MEKEPAYKIQLAEELHRRCTKNARYSIRAFARALNLDPGALSRILSGKQIPSFHVAEKILSNLDFTPNERAIFLDSLNEVQKKRPLKRVRQESNNPFLNNLSQNELNIELYKVISSWYHIAILELTMLDNFEGNSKWISKQLGISQVEAKLALDRLFDLNLLEVKNGKIRKTQEQLTTNSKTISTPALRTNQKEFLEKAIESLENDPIEERNTTSMTMAIDPELLPLAKEKIHDFNKELCQLLESKSKRRVYNLEIALYPLQKKET